MHWKRKYDNYNCSAFYEPSYVIARAYQNGRFSFGGRDKMKKKIALIITIAVCIVSVSANVYQYRVIRNKDAQILYLTYSVCSFDNKFSYLIQDNSPFSLYFYCTTRKRGHSKVEFNENFSL